MMRTCYGKICPYCKTVLEKNDDVVICSECQMPHHKQCWIENKGCTTFACKGTIDVPRDFVENRIDLDYDDFKEYYEDTSNITNEKYVTIEADVIKWNRWAFVFSEYWLIYNQIYTFGIIVYLINTVLVFINLNIALLVSLAFHMVIGGIGEFVISKSYEKNKRNETEKNGVAVTLSVGLLVLYGIIAISQI